MRAKELTGRDYDIAAMDFVSWAWASIRDGANLDGGDVQDKLHSLELLQTVRVTAPCGEDCACAEWDAITPDAPATCYRPTWKTP